MLGGQLNKCSWPRRRIRGIPISQTKVEITVGNLASAITAHDNRLRGPRCSFGKVLDKLDESDRKALMQALNSDVAGSVIAAALQAEGHKIKGHTVRRHRNRECSCGTR